MLAAAYTARVVIPSMRRYLTVLFCFVHFKFVCCSLVVGRRKILSHQCHNVAFHNVHVVDTTHTWSNQCRRSHPRSSPHTLHAIAQVREALSAATAVVCPTILGMTIDRHHAKMPVLKSVQGIGALTTILSAAHFSSLGISPARHYLYEICWTRFLPASLALSILSHSMQNEYFLESSALFNQTVSPGISRLAKEEVLAVSIPFILGCIGSILGCLLSYYYNWLGKDNNTRVHKRIFPGKKHYFWKPGHLLMKREEAAVAAGCLISSYIGGSFNYFDSARIIAVDTRLPGFANPAARGMLG